ncbi:hypothetical protein ONE63_011212 [Megalurothrips usitatus]|uniref:Uncharacterized protein n=1 Tax=Megalurothrips usitatus TaxID=439358 RepID=A0AAV7X3H0_9NEOP|nr:hypothetical protein ONE63_011212 [Megalurothrips usitatus]
MLLLLDVAMFQCARECADRQVLLDVRSRSSQIVETMRYPCAGECFSVLPHQEGALQHT